MGRPQSRTAGILLAIPSLPGRSGSVGTLGEEAYRFVDFLAAAGQSYWQILPLGPVGKSRSPYQTRSAFAGNPAWIDTESVQEKGADYEAFLGKNMTWLDDYALFEAVRAGQEGRPLGLWPQELRNPSARTVEGLKRQYQVEVEAVRFEQYRFFRQWRELKRYANLKGIGIIGDLPIYVYGDSAEFWLRRRLFDIDRDGRPTSSAGVPPDRFSEVGQVWNNPVYDWAGHKKELLGFWRERLAQATRLYDGVRIDHFRALADYYAVPVNATGEAGPPQNGMWKPGPGKAFIDMMHRDFPGMSVIAEDLGELSDAAKELVEYSGFPGMKVLQFAFSGDSGNPYLPHNITENSTCFTGTHDNNTLVGWLRSAPAMERKYALDYLGLSHREDLPDALLAAALASKAETVIIPLQDWLGLGTEARMNRPGTVSNRNWKWQCPPEALTTSLAKRIRHKTKDLYNR
ncbi:MAG: 4-alpha-glucanotransferase [Coriobacteriia bacterium]|nr:4-alpha-glucanotransferase [Coriobacteriia bacterium]